MTLHGLYHGSRLPFIRVSKDKGVVYVYSLEADSHVLELYTFLIFTNTSLRTKVGGYELVLWYKNKHVN